METQWATPQINDVVVVDDVRGIVRAVHPDGHIRVASRGDHDEGEWVKPTEVRVVFREGESDVADKLRRPRGNNRAIAIESHSLAVDPVVVAKAHEICRPGERFVPVDESTMRSVYI